MHHVGSYCTNIIVCTWALKTRTFTCSRQWIYRYLQTGVAQNHSGLYWFQKTVTGSQYLSVFEVAVFVLDIQQSYEGKICYQHHTEPDISIVMSGHFYCKSLCILIVVYLFLLFVHVFLTTSIYSYCRLGILIVRQCILKVVYVFLLLSMYFYCSSMYS